MASAIPSVLVAITVVLTLTFVAIGFVAYYTNLWSAPEQLPAYGTVYVRDVSNDTVEIVNKYGYPVRTVFAIYVEDIDDYVMVERTIDPGINVINLTKLVEAERPDIPNPSVDPYKSYFVIGSTSYRLVPGSGRLPPANFYPGGSVSYTVAGIGLKCLDPKHYDKYAVLYFAGSDIYAKTTLVVDFGYNRSISRDTAVRRVVQYEYGKRCDCRAKMLIGGTPESYKTVISNETVTKTITTYSCSDLECPVVVCRATDYRYKARQVFYCARDEERTWWLPGTSYSFRFVLKSPALLGFVHEELLQSKDFELRIGGATNDKTSSFPYEIDPKYCTYVYREYLWEAAPSCSYYECGCEPCRVVEGLDCTCSESRILVDEEIRYACPSDAPLCVAYKNFMWYRILNGSSYVEIPLTKGSVYVVVDSVYYIEYDRIDDPEYDDLGLRFLVKYYATFSLPPAVAYVSIPYHSKITYAYFGLTARVRSASIVVSTTDSGEHIVLTPYVVVDPDHVRASVQPVGYSATSAKTYVITSPRRLTLWVHTYFASYYGLENMVYLQPRPHDVVKVRVHLELELVPKLEVMVSGAA